MLGPACHAALNAKVRHLAVKGLKERSTQGSQQRAVSSQVPVNVVLSLLNEMSTYFLTSSSYVYPTSGLACMQNDIFTLFITMLV